MSVAVEAAHAMQSAWGMWLLVVVVVNVWHARRFHP